MQSPARSAKWATKRHGPASPSVRLDPVPLSRSASAGEGERAGVPPFKPRRILPSLILNFIDESGTLSDDIDLETHRKQNHQHITNAVVQELSDLIPTLTSLNLGGCFEVTDVGLWALSRSCAKLSRLILRGMPQVTLVGLRDISLSCKGMRILDLSYCSGIDDSAVRTIAANLWGLEDINLSGTKVTDSALSSLASCCHAIRSINLSNMAHVGDVALSELAHHCTGITKLDVCNTRFVKGPGLAKIAENCRDMVALNLTGCVELRPDVLQAFARGCTGITTLNISGCAKTTDAAVAAVARSLPLLQALDLEGCVRLSRSGIIELAEHADALLHLSLAEIPQFCGALPAALASGCTSLRSLDLSGCVRIDEHNVRTLVTSMTRVTELKLNRCRLIERQFLKNLADELPFVQNATEFYGLVGLPDCDARIYLAELRRAQLKAVAPLQRLARGMLARMRTRRLRLARQRENAAFMIQRVWRGFLDRRRVRQLVKGLTLEEAAIMIQSCERGWIGRLKVRRLKWRLLMAARRSRAATTVQATWRRYLARCLYGRLLDQKFLREQARRRMELLRQKSASIIATSWKIYRARCHVMGIKEARRRELALRRRRHQAATDIQRIMRGKLARMLMDRMRAFLALMIRQAKACLLVQMAVRRFISRREVARRRREREIRMRWKAASRIQAAYRGSRGRHIYAIILSLSALRAVENAAALRIQTKYRTYLARKFLHLMRQAQQHQRVREKFATIMQGAFRGMQGRQWAEITRNMMAVRKISGPLQAAIAELDEQSGKLSQIVATLQKRIRAQEDQIMTWDAERRKLEDWKHPTYDTDALTGTKQRYKVAFLKDALGGQMARFHSNLKTMQDQLYKATEQLSAANRELRMKRREMIPLEKGIATRTMQERRDRFKKRKETRHLAAATIQGMVRGRQTRRKMRLGLWPSLAQTAQLQAQLADWATSYANADGSTGWTDPNYAWNAAVNGYSGAYGYGAGDAAAAATSGYYDANAATATQQGYYGGVTSPSAGAAWSDTAVAAAVGWDANAQAWDPNAYAWDGQGYSAYGQYGYASVPTDDQYWSSGAWQGDSTGWFFGGWDGTQWQSYYTGGDATAADGSAATWPATQGYDAYGGYGVTSPTYDAAAYAGAGGDPATAADGSMAAAAAEQPDLYPSRGSRKRVKPKKRLDSEEEEEAAPSDLLDLSPRFPQAAKLHAAAGPRPNDSCVPRDPYSGMPTLHIPRILRHKLALVDREAFPYRERRMHVAYLQKLLAEEDWLRTAGVADQIVAKQRTSREHAEADRRKRDEEARKVAAVAAERRRLEEIVGMAVCDKESRAWEDFYGEWLRLEQAKRDAEAKKRLNAARAAMQREDELSAKVERVYRAFLADREEKKRVAAEKAARLRERADMTESAKESRVWNDMWVKKDAEFKAFNIKVGEKETELMDEEEERSEVMNRVWRRIGRAADYVRARRRAAAAAATAGLPSPKSAVVEDEATAEREAVREFLVSKGILKAEPVPEPEPEPDVDADDDEFDGLVERGRGGWVSVVNDDGLLYYFNEDSGVSQWERPDDF